PPRYTDLTQEIPSSSTDWKHYRTAHGHQSWTRLVGLPHHLGHPNQLFFLAFSRLGITCPLIHSREGWGRVTVLLPFIASIFLLGDFVFWQHILEKRMKQFLLVGEGWSKPTQTILKLDLFRRDHHRFSI
ncbi:hypothetical protein VP01_10673g1, partial [Puccinia sorghi]